MPANYVQIVQQQSQGTGGREGGGGGGGGGGEGGRSGESSDGRSTFSLSATPTARHRDTEEESLLTD